GGRPTVDQGADALGDAGGVIGLAIGEPLRTAGSIYGAVLVLGAVGLIGGVLFTGIPMASVLDAIGRAFARLRHSGVDGSRGFFGVGECKAPEGYDADE